MNEQYFANILDEQIRVFWAGNKYYPATSLTLEEQNEIAKISCIRYSFEKQESIFESNVELLCDIIFDNNLSNIYQVYLGYSAEYPNRVRSHKGILPKKVNDLKSFIEIELPYKDKTIIGGIIKLTKPVCAKKINLILDSRKGFILSSNSNLFSKSQIVNIISKYRDESSETSINYIKLIIDSCSVGNKIYKFSNLQDVLSMDCFFPVSRNDL